MIIGALKQGLLYGVMAFIVLAMLHFTFDYPENLSRVFGSSIAVAVGGAAGFAFRKKKAAR